MRGLNRTRRRDRDLPRRHDGPAGDHLGEIGDVGLRVAGAHAERMQFEDLAREIFVEALAAPHAGKRVGADRARIVEIEQHRRMRLDREQHVGELPEHMRADRLALIGAADRPRRPLVGGNAEMVRPEPDQPLGEADIGVERGIVAGLGLGEINLLRQRRFRALLPALPAAPKAMSFLGGIVAGFRHVVLRRREAAPRITDVALRNAQRLCAPGGIRTPRAGLHRCSMRSGCDPAGTGRQIG